MAEFENRGIITIIGIIIVVAVVIWVLKELKDRKDDTQEDDRERRDRWGGLGDGEDRDRAMMIGGWVILIVIVIVAVYLVSAAVKGLDLAHIFDYRAGADAAARTMGEYGSYHHNRRH